MDIVKRLRWTAEVAEAEQLPLGIVKLTTDAADEIERLRDLVKPLETQTGARSSALRSELPATMTPQERAKL